MMVSDGVRVALLCSVVLFSATYLGGLAYVTVLSYVAYKTGTTRVVPLFYKGWPHWVVEDVARMMESAFTRAMMMALAAQIVVVVGLLYGTLHKEVHVAIIAVLSAVAVYLHAYIDWRTR